MKHHQIWKLNEHHHLQKVFLKKYGRIAVNVWILCPEELGGVQLLKNSKNHNHNHNMKIASARKHDLLQIPRV